MKEKISQLREFFSEKIAKDKKLSAVIALIVVVGIVIAVASLGKGDGKKTGDNAGSSENQLRNDVQGSSQETASGTNSTTGKNEKGENQTTNQQETGNGSQNPTTGAAQTETTGNANANGNNGTTANNQQVAGGQNNQQSGGNQTTGNNNTGSTGTNNSTANTGTNTTTGNGGSSNTSGNTSANTTGGANRQTSGGSTTGGNTGKTGNTGNTGTTGNTGSTTTGGNNTKTSSGTDTPQGNEESLYNQLFDMNNKVTISLDISDAELQKLQADYKKYGKGKSPIYRKVTKMTVTINNTSYEMYDVGVRMKGNTSRCDVYNNNNLNDRNLIHMKLSFDEAFDDQEYYGNEALKWNDAERKQRKSRTFATLDGLELKWNRNFDGTYVTNVYANLMYRAFGVYAQNTSLANIRFGGYNYGVYTIYEPINKKFLKRNMPNASDGDLYKCGWSNVGASYTKNTLSSIGIETPYKALTYDLKTNKSSSNHQSLKNLINQLNSSNSKATFSSLVDSDNWVMFAAVSYFVGNPDDLRNNYNNHYVYFKNGKAVFMPYDYDRCFGIVTEGNEDMANFSPYADNTAIQGGQSNPLYLNSITGRNNNFTAEYTSALKKVADSGWLNYANFKKYYNMAYNNYSSVAVPDSNVHVYVKPFGSNSGRVHDSAKLGFNENNGFNTSVSTYMSKIMNRYQQAMSK